MINYGGKPIEDPKSLTASVRSVDAQVKDVPLTFEREGVQQEVRVAPGPLGLELSGQPPQVAGPVVAASVRQDVARSARARGRLSPLPGTRDEVREITQIVRGASPDASVVTLVGRKATEDTLTDRANRPTILHLATHGLVDPFQGVREAALALTPPRMPVPGNDGFLALGDLLERWQGKLDGTALVVLSACESQTGKLDPHEGMLALPWGFCFAGARSVVASLWKVDDQGTRRLMVEFYKRLMQEEVLRPCEALHEARKAMKNTHPDPYDWSPFVFVGAP